jgi:heme exporter protein D
VNWGGWNDFFAMGGYGLYVWGSYAVTFALLVCEVVFLRLRKRNILAHLGRAVAVGWSGREGPHDP